MSRPRNQHSEAEILYGQTAYFMGKRPFLGKAAWTLTPET